MPLVLLAAFGMVYAMSPDVIQAACIAVVPIGTAVYRGRLNHYWRELYRGGTEVLTIALLVVNIWALHAWYEGCIAAFGRQPGWSMIVLTVQLAALALIVGLRLGWLLAERVDVSRLSGGPGGPVDPRGFTQCPIESLNERLAATNRKDEKE